MGGTNDRGDRSHVQRGCSGTDEGYCEGSCCRRRAPQPAPQESLEGDRQLLLRQVQEDKARIIAEYEAVQRKASALAQLKLQCEELEAFFASEPPPSGAQDDEGEQDNGAKGAAPEGTVDVAVAAAALDRALDDLAAVVGERKDQCSMFTAAESHYRSVRAFCGDKCNVPTDPTSWIRVGMMHKYVGDILLREIKMHSHLIRFASPGDLAPLAEKHFSDLLRRNLQVALFSDIFRAMRGAMDDPSVSAREKYNAAPLVLQNLARPVLEEMVRVLPRRDEVYAVVVHALWLRVLVELMDLRVMKDPYIEDCRVARLADHEDPLSPAEDCSRRRLMIGYTSPAIVDNGGRPVLRAKVLST